MLKIARLVQPVAMMAIVASCVGNPIVPTRANSVNPRDRASAALAAQQNTIASKPAVENTGKLPVARPNRITATDKVETVSGTAEIELAEYLAANDVKFYGAYWCSHCKEQKALFGAVAASKLPYIECAANGDNSQRQLCKDKNIQMFPTWAIKGQLMPGTRDLKQIAELTGYQGSMNFKYKKK